MIKGYVSLKVLDILKHKKKENKYYIYFICPKHEILGIQKMTRGNMNRSHVTKCQYCISKNLPHWYVQYVIESQNPYSVVSEYIGMNQILKCHCNVHNKDFEHDVKFIFYNGQGCDLCTKEKHSSSSLLSHDEVIKRLNVSNPEVEIVDFTQYSGFHSQMEFRCKKCGYKWYSPFGSVLINKTGCPSCSPKIYKGELEILKVLSKYQIPYQTQYRINECKNKRYLPFDVAIFNHEENLIALVEYQGKQHYHSVDFFGGNKSLIKQQENDLIKRNFCIEKNYSFINNTILGL